MLPRQWELCVERSTLGRCGQFESRSRPARRRQVQESKSYFKARRRVIVCHVRVVMRGP